MATITAPARQRPGLLARPVAATGLWGWLTTVDAKKIGILYGVTALIFFLIGGMEALLMRTQLAVPNNNFVSPGAFNALFTMHGTTMIFLVVMPLSAAFFNYVVPLQIGARDVAFPRLNAFSYWTFLAGALLMHIGFLVGQVPDMGWFGYANLTDKAFSPSMGVDFWVVGLQVLGVSSLAAGLNFLVTIVNLRAPGMSLMRMPLFTWTTLITVILIVLAFPVLAVSLVALMFDRLFATNFFNTANGGDPILWQHLFWVFAHPEVYILILPAMGIVSEIIPVFSRKPLFGYPFMVYAVVSIAFLSFTVWAHHMFATGLGPIATSFFAASTMLIAVPTGIKIFNWLATLWGGSVRFNTPMNFAVSFIGMFTIGGLTGVMHASPPVDMQQSDTYFIVAHLHYVLFAGSVMALFGGIYYWFPKITGKFLDERLGQVHFWSSLIGLNLVFGPMHFLGIDGMPRRIFTYSAEMGWNMWNMVATFGAFLVGLSVLVFILNVMKSLRMGERAGADPWDGRTLEWSVSSPPPHYNFAEIPVVHGRDPFWTEKYPAEGHGAGMVAREVRGPEAEGHGHEDVHVHLPDPSYWPLLTSAAIFVTGFGLLFVLPLVPVGVLGILFGAVGWATEPVNG